MALNIINDPSLTAQLATGLGSGLTQLAHAKAQNMLSRQQQQSTRSGLQGIGLSEQEAQALSQLPQEYQGKILQAYLERGGGGGGQQGQSSLGNTLSQPTQKEQRENAIKERKFEFEREKEVRKNQDKLSPFLKAEASSFKNSRKLKHVAQELLQNIEKNKKKFPGAILGNLPEKARNILLRDKDVRKYMADANKAVILAAQTRKGVPSNYKIRMEQLAKGDISMPIETQEEIWKSFIQDEEMEEQRQKYIRSKADKNGLFPLDIEQKTVDFELAQDNPLDYPEFYQEGTQIEENGKIYTLENGSWKE